MDEFQQLAVIEEEPASWPQKRATEAKEEIVGRTEGGMVDETRIPRVEHRDDQPVIVEEPIADGGHIDLKVPLKTEVIPNDVAQPPLPEDILPAPMEISAIPDEAEAKPLISLEPKPQEALQLLEYSMQDQPDPEEPLAAEEAIHHEAADSSEPDTLVSNEITFDDEVMDTFEQLIELAYIEQAIEEETTASDFVPDAEQQPILMEGQFIFLNPETPDPVELNAFEEFVMTQTAPEASPDLETVIANANEQTLEETFLQLSFYLAETTSEDQSPESPAIVIGETLRDLAELLSRNNGSNTAEEDKVTITPELTQKLLTLLRAVGYDNPREILLKFIDRHDFEFLLQAIRHLYQLCDDDNRQELLNKQVAISTSRPDEPLTVRLGRSIFSLITRLEVPEPAISD